MNARKRAKKTCTTPGDRQLCAWERLDICLRRLNASTLGVTYVKNHCLDLGSSVFKRIKLHIIQCPRATGINAGTHCPRRGDPMAEILTELMGDENARWFSTLPCISLFSEPTWQCPQCLLRSRDKSFYICLEAFAYYAHDWVSSARGSLRHFIRVVDGTMR